MANDLPMQALLLTARNVMIRPESSFAEMKQAAGIGRAWLYALLVGSIATMANLLWSLLPLPGTEMFGESGALASGQDTTVSSLLTAPLLISLQLFLGTLYVRVVLALTKATNRSFATAFRIVSYANTALLLQIVPIAGTFAAMVYWVYLILSGVRGVYGVPRWRTLLLLAAPMILLFAMLFAALTAIALILGLAGQDILRQLLSLG